MTTIVIWTDEEYMRLSRGIVYLGSIKNCLMLFGNPPRRRFNKETMLWED